MKRLGQLLLDFGWIEGNQLEEALQTQKVMGGRIGSCLLEVGALDEPMLLKALAHQRSVPAARTSDLKNVPEEVYGLVPARVAVRCQAIPFRMLGSDLYVALLDVDNLDLHDEIAFASGKQVRAHIGNEVRVFSALHHFYGRELSERFRQLEAHLDRPDSQVPRRSGFGRALGDSPVAGASEDEATFPAVAASDDGQEPLPLNGFRGSSSNHSRGAVTTEFLPRFATSEQLARALDQVDDRDQMARIFVEQIRPNFRRVILFQVRTDTAVGWIGEGPEIDQRMVEEVEVDLDQPSIFQDLNRGRPVHQGPLASLKAHRPVFQAFGEEPPEECVSLPVRLGRRLVGAVVGEVAEDRDAGEVKAVVGEACEALGDALGNYLLRHRATG